MNELVLKTNTLPEPIASLIRSDKVKVRAIGGEIRMSPIHENLETDRFLDIKHAATLAEDRMRRLYELCGSGSDLALTVDSFLDMTHDDKELNNE